MHVSIYSIEKVLILVKFVFEQRPVEDKSDLPITSMGSLPAFKPSIPYDFVYIIDDTLNNVAMLIIRRKKINFIRAFK